jgi:hypothetical protein
MPTNAGWLIQSIRIPRPSLRRVFQDAAPFPHVVQRSVKAPAVISRPVVISTPPLEVHGSHCAPQLAWRVGNHRMRPLVLAGVSTDVPRVNTWQAEVAPVSLDE